MTVWFRRRRYLQWSVHVCFLDEECRDYGAPWALYWHIPWGSLTVFVPLQKERVWDENTPEDTYWSDLPQKWSWHKVFSWHYRPDGWNKSETGESNP